MCTQWNETILRHVATISVLDLISDAEFIQQLIPTWAESFKYLYFEPESEATTIRTGYKAEERYPCVGHECEPF